jgi:hypothetical protein
MYNENSHTALRYGLQCRQCLLLLLNRLDSPLAHVLRISIMPHAIASVEHVQMPSIRGRGRVGLWWGGYLSILSCMSVRKTSLSVWTCLEVDLGPASTLFLCLSLVKWVSVVDGRCLGMYLGMCL